MRRSYSLKAVLGALGALALAIQTQAIPITGTISYVSSAVPDNSDLNLATAFAFGPVGLVVSATGDLVGVGAAVANAAGISGLPAGLGPAPGAVPVLALWSGGGFTFDLTSLAVDFRSANQFTASGSGTMSAAGFDDTPATWTLAITGEGPVLGLAAGSKALEEVPDFGNSALLASLGLAGIVLYRRKAS